MRCLRVLVMGVVGLCCCQPGWQDQGLPGWTDVGQNKDGGLADGGPGTADGASMWGACHRQIASTDPAHIFRGDLRIFDQEELEQLEGIQVLLGDLWIKNADIESLASLASLQFVEGFFELSDEANLESVEGLEQLTCVGGGMWIGENPNLASLAGLESVKHLGGYLAIRDNRMLETVGLDQLGSVASYFDITGNPKLQRCQAILLRDQVEEAYGIGGEVNIRGNLSDCASASCDAGTCVEDCKEESHYRCE